ncbi:macrolide ABC transporter ATP-binding protein [candidate division TA06 bacterium]|uniref:Macrolide ABC transporter ATP-binding protein n=1 Tax=candidate division TA06 bacterium TaxID=2250710 RepID=A0A660SE84_UNCT6|nr:MAG: macrolide ABC transporter ATP-binding protein [candidate division TA06 bacterium]
MLITAKNLKKSYLMGEITIRAIRDISVDIKENSFVSIMGPSGSGKSTLMHILGCLDKPDEGEFSIKGRSVHDLTDDELASIRNNLIGFVFQTFNLIPRMNALHNVELPLLYRGEKQQVRREKSIKSLEIVGLGHRIHHNPNELSGGERQRVAIARAMVTDPSIIIADEPTGNLDSKTGEEILVLFDKLHKNNKTIIMVTHQREVAEIASEILHLKDGQIIDREIISN